ncbi:CD300 molecule like family member f, partial [Chelydra serpentina]
GPGAVTGPGAVRGPTGGSVAVRCRYREGSERYPKFWCREGGNLLCSNGHIVQTDGSEAEVTRGRVSIRDNHPQRVFTVTVGNLTPADAGTYHCGVGRRRWRWAHALDLSYPVELTVSPGKSRRGPRQCRGCRARGRAGGRWKGGACLDRQIHGNPGGAKRRRPLCAEPGSELPPAAHRPRAPPQPPHAAPFAQRRPAPAQPRGARAGQRLITPLLSPPGPAPRSPVAA